MKWFDKLLTQRDYTTAQCWVITRVNIITYDPYYLQEGVNDPQQFNQYAEITLIGFATKEAWLAKAPPVASAIKIVRKDNIETCECYPTMLLMVAETVLTNEDFIGAEIKDSAI
jgi:hypothetical protein